LHGTQPEAATHATEDVAVVPERQVTVAGADPAERWAEIARVAENAVESLRRGTRVIAQGGLQQRKTREAEKQAVIEMAVDEIGPSLTVQYTLGGY